MKVPLRRRERGLHFNITPLIDIVFLLIIFFLAASHLARSETAQAVELPEATRQTDEAELAQRVVVTITAEERFYVGGNEMLLPQLEFLIQQAKIDAGEEPLEVQIRADRTVPYGTVEPLMLSCVKVGITKLNWAVLPTR